MKVVFWVVFFSLGVCTIGLYLWYFFFQLILKSIYYILKLILVWGFLVKFLFDDHRLWYRLFAQSLDFEFFDFQTQKWFFKWLNWNLVNLEFIILYTQIFRTCYLYFLVMWSFLKKIYFFFKKKFNFFSIIRNHFWYTLIYFFFKKNMVSFFSTSLFVKMWMFFVWWRTYIFIMTRLDFNFWIWSFFNEEAIQGQIRGFKLETIDNMYSVYLRFFRPVFFSNYITNNIISLSSQLVNFIQAFIYLYIFKFFQINLNIHIYFSVINEEFFSGTLYSLKIFFVQSLNNVIRVSIYIRLFLFKFLYFGSIFCLYMFCFICNLGWFFLSFIYKIRKILFLILFINFFGIYFFRDIIAWFIPTWSYIQGMIGPAFNNLSADVYPFLFNKLDKSSWFSYLYFRKWYFNRIWRHTLNVDYYWLIYDYDFLLMSLKRIGEMETPEGDPIEDWQKLLVWLESFKWTPMARNAEDDLQLWTEGLKMKKLHETFQTLKFDHLSQEYFICWDRILKVKYYPYDLAVSWYKRLILWKWWGYIFWKRAKWKKKKWYRMVGRLRNLTSLKWKLFWFLFVTREWYNVWIWFARFKFFFFVALFDTYICFWLFYWINFFFALRFVKMVISLCMKNIYLLIFVWKIFLFFWNFIFLMIINLILQFKFSLYTSKSWYLLYLYIKPFIPEFTLAKEFELSFYYSVFYVELFYQNLLISVNFLFYGWSYRPVWGNWLKTVFTTRDYIKSFFDIFYLEYDSFVHRRYTYKAYCLQSIAHHKYRLKKRRGRRHHGGGGWMRPRLLKKVGVGRFLLLPNNLASEHFGRILGLAYDSTLYWKSRRFIWRIKWFGRCHKLFRTMDYLILCIWAWIIFCLFFFIGFRYFFCYKLLNDFNGLFYWNKVRKQPIDDLSKLFKKLDRKLIRSKLHRLVKNLEFSSGVWMVDFKGEILLTRSENMKAFYKDALKSILEKPTSFKWRLRTLKTNVINNWDKVEFYFFDKSTENYFETWITHSVLLNLIVFELMLITSNKDIHGLIVNTMEDEDMYENVESSKSLIIAGNSLTNNLFKYFFWIDNVLFRCELPEWIWHKDGFLIYHKFYSEMQHSSTVSFDEYVLGVLTPILVWGLFIPCLFFFALRIRLKKKKWRSVKWAVRFFKIFFWQHFDLYGELMTLVLRAYFNTQAFFMYRGKFSGKSFNVMRRRKKLKMHKRFIWHYLKTCYPDFAFFRPFIKPSTHFWTIFAQRGTLSSFLNWFNLLWWILFSLSMFLYLKLSKYLKLHVMKFRSELKTMNSFQEFVVHWMHWESYMHQKIILRNWCKKYGFNS